LLEGLENSTIWQSLQEDQDRSVPSLLRMGARERQRNAIQTTTSELQEISQIRTHDPIGADESIRGRVEGQVGAHYLYAPSEQRSRSRNSELQEKHSYVDSQQWMDVMTGLREIWLQNSLDDPTDMSNTVVAILNEDSLTAYEAAVEDLTVDPDDDTQVILLTEDHVKNVLRAVSETVFPFCALETQKQWISKHMKKPYNMMAKTMTHGMSKINNFLPYFLEGGVESKYSESELILASCSLRCRTNTGRLLI
jgi:hypothetical protein